MTPREILAAYAREHLPEIWDGGHDWVCIGSSHGGMEETYHCRNCTARSNGTDGRVMWRGRPCPGPDFTKDTDVLLGMFQSLGLRGRHWTPLFWKFAADGSSDISRFKEALLAAVLAGIAELEVGDE